ncbi:sodium:solute symporter family protein [Candidatus Marinimicrobia bacterium]|nr:sodium:solute symporter family protein [Candidatus Neomarinimicrobiota bacterium]
MHLIDFIIIGLYLTLIFCVGIFTRKYIKDFSDFMIANRSVSLSLGVVTMLGTELGLITVMYNAQTGINGLFSSFHIGLAAFIVTLLIGLTGFVVVKLRKLRVKSIPEYYSIRFGPNTRIIGAILLSLGGILNMGLFLKVGAIFIQSIFGISNNDNLLTIIMFILLVLVLVYTVSGGMISVIVTDYIQYVILSIGFMFCVFYSIKTLGWNNLFESLEFIVLQNNENYNIDKIYNPIDRMGGFYISWQVVLGFVSAVIWPTSITRVLSIESSTLVKKQYIWSSFSFLIRFIIPCFLGICAYVYFNGNIGSQSLSLMPMFLAEILPVGVLGIVIAGMLAAFMSTHDSYLLCWSSIITNDIIEPLSNKKLSSDFKIFITRIIILILGIYIFYWGMFYEGSDAIWDYLGITGAIYFTGAISVVVLGLYWKKASSSGAVLSLLGGLSSIVGLEPVREYIGIGIENPAIIGLLSLFFSLCLMIIGSLILPDKKD